jgi:ketosteroid isomerase-like protein
MQGARLFGDASGRPAAVRDTRLAMSQAEIETLRAVYEAVSRGDWDEAFRDADPEFELRPPDQNPIAGSLRGREAIRGFFDELWAAFDEVTVQPREFLQLDDRILVSLLMQLRPSDSGAKVEMHLTHLWTMRDGRPARCSVFLRREEALEAAGVQE